MITANKMFDECVSIIRAHGLSNIEPVNLSMRGHTALYMDRIEEGLKDVQEAAERAAEAGNRRAEMPFSSFDLTPKMVPPLFGVQLTRSRY